MFRRLSAFAERRAPFVVLAWVVGAVALVLTAPSLQDVGTVDQTAFLPSSAPSQQADRLLRRLYPDDPSAEAAILVFSRPGGLQPVDRDHIGQVVEFARSRAMRGDVKSVQSVSTAPELAPGLRSPDGAAELVAVSFARPAFTEETNQAVERLRDHMDATAPRGLEHHATGSAALGADQNTASVESFDRTAVITIALVLVILVFVYRSALAPLVPLVTIGVAFVVSRGVVAVAADHGFEVASVVETFLVVMVFGAGTDYCLFVVSRYRQELAARDPLPATLRRTMAVVGPVVAASGATVVIGFLSQLTARFGVFRTQGPAIGIAILVTVFASLTLTPALLRMAGRGAFWPASIDAVRRRAEHTPGWERLAGLIRRHPVRILTAGALLLAVPSVALVGMNQSFDLVRDLPPSADAREGFETLARHYPGGRVAPVHVVVAGDSALDDADLQAVDGLTDALRRHPGVAEVRSVTQPAGEPLRRDNVSRFTGVAPDPAALGFGPGGDVGPLAQAIGSPEGLRFTGPVLRAYPQLAERLGQFQGKDGRSTRLILSLDGNPYDYQALDVIRDLDKAAGARLAGSSLEGARLAVGGPSAFAADMQDIGTADFRVMVAVLIGAIFVVLAVLLRSLVAPFFLLATVLLSFAATMGLTVVLFQGILGERGLSFWVAPFLFIILVALGADYNIFIMSRIREEADAGHEIHEAAGRGLVLTGRVITSAGVILAGTFAALVLAPLPNLRQMGFAVTVGILIDTFVVRSLLVPSATVLLGRWALWPSWPGGQRAPVRPRQVAVAGAGVAALALLLAVIVAGRETETVVRRVGDGPASAGTARPVERPEPAAGLPAEAGPG
jgi:RND superfamily putative drug exporter